MNIIQLVYADSVITTIPVGDEPYGAVYNPDNDKIYVANYGHGSVSVIDPQTNTVVNAIENAGTNPRELAYNSVNGYKYVANTFFGQESGSVAVIHPRTNQVIKTITEMIGTQPRGITYNSNNQRLELFPSNMLCCLRYSTSVPANHLLHSHIYQNLLNSHAPMCYMSDDLLLSHFGSLIYENKTLISSGD